MENIQGCQIPKESIQGREVVKGGSRNGVYDSEITNQEVQDFLDRLKKAIVFQHNVYVFFKGEAIRVSRQ